MPATLFDFPGRTALVTGGSKGLGKAMARALAEADASVAISSPHEDELKSAAAEIGRESHAKVVPLAGDMTHRGKVKRLAEQAIAALGKVDIVINNAGGNMPQPIDQITDEVWDHFVELNLSNRAAWRSRGPRFLR
jgi:NAD(P)-dependent dehydrogenase (short-subunit alcohol dehydrogenase family)